VFEGEYGLVKFRGFTWVGCISEAFMEVWRRTPAMGSAFQDGNRMEGYYYNKRWHFMLTGAL
jgi:hypothetical protein